MTRLDVVALYRDGPGSEYSLSAGYNWRALVAVAGGVIPVLPSFIHAADDRGLVIADPGFFDQLYRYGVFVAFGISAVTYVALSAAARTEPSTAAVAE